MRRFAPAVVVVVMVSMLVGCSMLGGVGKNDALITAVETYTAAVQTMANLRDAGVLSAEAVAKVEPYRQAARAALDAWRAVIDAKGDVTATAAVAASALTQLSQALVDARGDK